MMTSTNLEVSPALTLPACIGLDAAEVVRREILMRLEAGQGVRIDASQVELLELPGLQVVLAASRAQGVAIVNPSSAFSQTMTALAITCATSDGHPAVASAPLPEPKSDARATRVLAIDDSKTMRDMLRLTLTSAGFEVLQAVDGLDGLDVLTRESVDVVITDINMPKLDGYGVIESLRGNPAFDATPILVLTTESDTEKKQRARDLGATGFIVKPFDPDTLVQVIHKVFPRKPI